MQEDGDSARERKWEERWKAEFDGRTVLDCKKSVKHDWCALIWKSRNGAVYAFALPGTDLHRRFSVASLCKHLALLVEGSTTKNTESHFRSKLFLLKTAESNTAALSRRYAVSRRYAGTAESDAAIAADDEGEDADTSIDAFCSSAQPMFAGKGI